MKLLIKGKMLDNLDKMAVTGETGHSLIPLMYPAPHSVNIFFLFISHNHIFCKFQCFFAYIRTLPAFSNTNAVQNNAILLKHPANIKKS